MKNKYIDFYEFKDLDDKAKSNVIYWLDRSPQEYEKEDGSFGYNYYCDLSKDEHYIIEEMCEINGYLFDYRGEPIHHYEPIQRNRTSHTRDIHRTQRRP
jgi:hypothetical protein